MIMILRVGAFVGREGGREGGRGEKKSPHTGGVGGCKGKGKPGSYLYITHDDTK